MSATKQEILDVLRRARERIADPTRWCRGDFAIDGEGYSTAAGGPRAVAWCAVGALGAFPAGVEAMVRAADYLNHAAHSRFGVTSTKVNDSRGHGAVLELYDRAIADAEAAVSA